MRIIKVPLTVLFIILITPAFGQQHSIGIQAGGVYTHVTSKDFVLETHFKPGFSAGLNYQFNSGKWMGLGIDLLYAQRGFTTRVIFTDEIGNPLGGSATVGFNYDYISLPVKGVFRFLALGVRTYGTFNAGVVPSFLVDARTVTPAIEGLSERTIVHVTEKVNRLDLGLLVELEVAHRIASHLNAHATFGFQKSLTSITNDNYFANSTIQHYGLAFSLGVRYVFGGEKSQD